ncbi:phosphocholine cytidylyltransferase/choline kinase family protein [Sporosarcina thermotolerans]|uniref:Phosphocholine cytidylyltransferase/choline kinase family protein n=1 Tax=Sporosarcina thermotolerans TaxID=633404 RepID=A0AAW9A8I1_9BACL|nr:phosphocholine cytidylyltransferase/choline kinase family protein [Sporosarcina thermotolerans]MDW0116948.1 phosphocholine cytidylyltransferase/choline kinase family protein [Sporosarcina thermotolerans]WHT47935.1 phosphocholine cytidylyltransferase/choline kinase family protein [Sporosarcina thermotolerans]
MHKFKILEILSKNADVNQRHLADECNLSIGKVNYTLNELTKDGFIETGKSGIKHHYQVTKLGKNYLLNELEQYQETKVLLHSNERKKVTQAVILVAGERKDFDMPVCLLDIQGTNLIERTVSCLEENDVEKIIIITGFKKEKIENYEGLKGKENIIFIENPRYLWTGSMASLAYAAEYITDDFILVEDDILIEEKAFVELLNHKDRDCMLITKESGSGDEALIELRNGYVYEISKDKHRLNQIDGEMVGITKISYEVFIEMLEIYKENKNPFINYEYTLLNVSRKVNLGYLKLPELIWSEIDNKEHYFKVTDKIYTLLKVKEEKFKEDKLKHIIADALSIDVKRVISMEPLGGLTNRNYKVSIDSKDYAVRFPGKGTERYLNRYAEKVNTEIVSALGVNPNILYFNEENGLKIVEYIQNGETLNPKTGRREDNIILVAQSFRKVHMSGEEFVEVFNVFEKITEYETVLKELKGQLPEDYEEVKRQVLDLKDKYLSLDFKLAPCHIDPLTENFVKSSEDKMYLIDWEYAGMNDPLWDIAMYAIEAGLTSAEEELFLTIYFNGIVTDEDTARVLMNKIFIDFLWTIWGLMKEAGGADFGSYAATRYSRAKNFLREYHSLTNKVIN